MPRKNLGIPLCPGQMGPEIIERIRCARLWCEHHWNCLCDPDLNSRSKFQLYKTFVRPILTYGCEIWNLSDRQGKKLLRFENEILVQIYKSKYPPRHPNRLRPNLKEVYRRFRAADVVFHINCERMQWTSLLEHEERALRRRHRRTVRWWDKQRSAPSKMTDVPFTK